MATSVFLRRANEESTTISSICMKCFQTIATKRSGEGAFILEEREHHCEPLEEQQAKYVYTPGTF
jgi:hypothetical protein